MNETKPDLHVVALQYSLIPSDSYSYTDPPPVEFETEDARFRLADGKLRCEMKTHFATIEAARAAIEPTLRAWEVAADLRANRGELRFKFERPEVIDRSPAPPGVVRGFAYVAGGALSVKGTLSVTHVTKSSYPEPPPGNFRLTPDAHSILDRYRGYLDGGQSLETMAYFCFTVLTGAGKDAAAKEYLIERAVLHKMSELSSTRGNPMTARKASAIRPRTGPESTWLQEVVKKLIWQLGTPKVERSLLKMSDLPPL